MKKNAFLAAAFILATCLNACSGAPAASSAGPAGSDDGIVTLLWRLEMWKSIR